MNLSNTKQIIHSGKSSILNNDMLSLLLYQPFQFHHHRWIVFTQTLARTHSRVPSNTRVPLLFGTPIHTHPFGHSALVLLLCIWEHNSVIFQRQFEQSGVKYRFSVCLDVHSSVRPFARLTICLSTVWRAAEQAGAMRESTVYFVDRCSSAPTWVISMATLTVVEL